MGGLRGVGGVGQAGRGLDLGVVMRELGERGVRELMVEGGPATALSFLLQHLVDRSVSLSLFVCLFACLSVCLPVCL